jgi:septal ring factor EnvC (AmiA/AmiB activator)
MSETFDALEQLYFTLKGNFGELQAACQTDQQRSSLKTAYAAARDNYNRAMNKMFDENEAAVAALRCELQDKQQQIETSLANLQEAGTVIDTITAAVTVGTKLVGVAA